MPTRDADLLGFSPDDIDRSRLGQDGGDPEGGGYGGVRVELRATPDGAQFSLQIDIGFGDVVTPAWEAVVYAVLLDRPAPHTTRLDRDDGHPATKAKGSQRTQRGREKAASTQGAVKRALGLAYFF